MLPKKIIYILIGQKGSGKSLAGQIIQDHYGIKFIRVEDIARKVKKGRSINDEIYHNEAFSQIESHIREKLKNESSLIFESIGLTPHFDRMLGNLRRDFRIFTLRINADPDICLERIKSRDKSMHIDVSDSEVTRINSLFRQKNLQCDFELTNNRSREELVSTLENIIEIIKAKS